MYEQAHPKNSIVGTICPKCLNGRIGIYKRIEEGRDLFDLVFMCKEESCEHVVMTVTDCYIENMSFGESSDPNVVTIEEMQLTYEPYTPKDLRE